MNNIIGLDKFYVWRESDSESLPDVSFVPSMTRRRMTDIEKIAVGIAHLVVPENSDYQMVFASRYGEWRQTIKLIQQFHDEGEMSPAGFSNSVHNAAAGAFSVMMKNKNSYISVAAGARTLESGILAALTTKKPVLFVFVEERSPDMYIPFLDAPVHAHGLAFMLSSDGKRKIQWEPQSKESSPLTFEALERFLCGDKKIENSCWKMEEK